MQKKKIVPWVDITCGKCGCLADHSGYYHKGIIAELKRDTKDWTVDDVYGTICSGCKKELDEERNEE